MKIRLSDGNRAILTARELLTVTKKGRWKRSRSGKSKYKTKTKRQKRVIHDVRVGVDSQKFECKELPSGREQRLYRKENNDAVILGFRFTEKLKHEGHLIPDPMLMIQGMVKVYSFLQPKTTA